MTAMAKKARASGVTGNDDTLHLGVRVEHEVLGAGVVVGWKNEGTGRGYTNTVKMDDGTVHHLRTHRLWVVGDGDPA